MKFEITQLNRTVELDDRLVEEYEKYENLRENSFIIAAIHQYGHKPTAKEISDSELSKLCNAVLFADLKTFALIPKALEFLEKNYEQFTNGKIQEYKIKE